MLWVRLLMSVTLGTVGRCLDLLLISCTTSKDAPSQLSHHVICPRSLNCTQTELSSWKSHVLDSFAKFGNSIIDRSLNCTQTELSSRKSHVLDSFAKIIFNRIIVQKLRTAHRQRCLLRAATQDIEFNVQSTAHGHLRIAIQVTVTTVRTT